jgi:PAS domain S-box-containing protein
LDVLILNFATVFGGHLNVPNVLEKIKYRDFLDTAYESIIIVDKQGLIEFANKQTRESLGYESNEIVGKPIEFLIPSNIEDVKKNNRSAFFDSAIPGHLARPVVAVRKDGTEIPIDVSLTPVETGEGSYIAAFIHDISEHKKVEDQLRFLSDTSLVLTETLNYHERIQKIAELVVPKLADVCVVHVLVNGTLIPKAISHRSPSGVQCSLDNSKILVVVKTDIPYGPYHVVKTEQPQLIENMTPEIIELISPNCSVHDFLKSNQANSYIGVPMSARGKMIGAISFIRYQPNSYTHDDVVFAELVSSRASMAVDNAKLYHDAQDAVHLREDVLAIVSHDLRNPLSVVKGFSEMLGFFIEAGPAQKEKAQHAIDVINRSVKQMERLIGDLLDFAKIQSGKLSLELKVVDIQKLVEDGIDSVQHHSMSKNIRIIKSINTKEKVVLCDIDRMRQVFTNILGNSIKFSSDNSKIEIEVQSTNSEVVFSIRDYGPGIDEKELENLFDRYWQSTKTAKLGTGLGLFIAKGIVENHHGQIWAESVVGHGATLSFTLPLRMKDSGFNEMIH